MANQALRALHQFKLFKNVSSKLGVKTKPYLALMFFWNNVKRICVRRRSFNNSSKEAPPCLLVLRLSIIELNLILNIILECNTLFITKRTSIWSKDKFRIFLCNTQNRDYGSISQNTLVFVSSIKLILEMLPLLHNYTIRLLDKWLTDESIPWVEQKEPVSL